MNKKIGSTHVKAKKYVDLLHENTINYYDSLEKLENDMSRKSISLKSKLRKIQSTCKHKNGKNVKIYGVSGKYKNHFICQDCYQGWYKVGIKFIENMRNGK